MTDRDLPVLEAYSRLKAIRENVPKQAGIVEEKYVTEFHDVLSLLEKTTGISLAGFRVPSDELQQRKPYSHALYSEKDFFCMKVDGALNLFEMLGGEADTPPRRIGFVPPGRST